MGDNSKVSHLQNKWISKLQYHNNQYIGIVKTKHIKFNASTQVTDKTYNVHCESDATSSHGTKTVSHCI